MRWLWIEGSPRRERARSSALARAFLDALAAARPDTAITHLNVWEADLPAFDGDAVEARYAVLFGEAAQEQVASWDRVRALFTHVHAHDALVISTPMWNWGIPYRLKQLIDVITQPGLAFTASADGVTGHFAGKPAVLLTSSALGYAGATAHLDHQVSYLKDWLGFIGVTEIHEANASPMYGPPEQVEPAHAAACAAAAALAGRF